MYITEKIRTDKTGRVGVKKIFSDLPNEVVVLFDTEANEVIFIAADESKSSLLKRKVDSKGRVSLPRWMTDELGDIFLVTTDSAERHSLLPAKLYEL